MGGRKNQVEYQPESPLDSGSTLGGRDGKVSEDGPHMDRPHDEDDHGRHHLDHSEPVIDVLEHAAVFPNGLLLDPEGYSPGSQNEMKQKCRTDNGSPHMRHIVGFKKNRSEFS